MNTIKRDVYVLRNTIKIPIEVTKGTDMLGLEFAVRDYEIPATAAAVAYVYHKSMDKTKGTLCDVDNSVISFTPSGDFFAVGMNELQIRVVNDGKSLISFKETIKCSDTMGFPDDEEEKQKTLVEQLLTKVGKEEGDRKTADDTEREERIAADDAEKKARIAEENARAEADEAIRANRIVTLDEIDLVTEEGFFVDALAVKELNSNLVNANNNIATINNKLISIVERGTKNNYNYTKYSNGDMVMWSKYTWNTNLATSWYNWYFASSAAVDFPVAFKEAPLIIVSPAKTDELYGLGVTEVTTTGYKLTAYSPKQGMCCVQADMLIIGKWK
ncbi:hypothetical protein JCM37173_24590 [Allocoprococcus similis]